MSTTAAAAVPRISASSYSNTAPLVWSFLYGARRASVELIMDTAPARSAELLRERRVDAALVPVIEYQRLDDVLLVPGVCVGARARVRSVCLVTKGGDLSGVRRVALDASSRTSVALSRIIFREFYDSEPDFAVARPNLTEMLESADCALLIGDPALSIDESRYRKFDLAEVWKNFTGCGFVFAMWMAQKEKAALARDIDFAAARDEGARHLDEIISNYEVGIPLPREEFRKYLSENISYSVDEDMRRGLELYFDLAHKHRLTEGVKPLRFL